MKAVSRSLTCLIVASLLAGCGGGSPNETSTPSSGASTPTGASSPDSASSPDGASAPTVPTRTVTFDPAMCKPQVGAPYGQTVGIVGTNLMVTSADVNASAAGCKVLANGGTAIDAAIAVQAVLGVTEAFASGMAGGSVITYYDAKSKQVRVFDGLAAAPVTTGGVTSIYQAAVPDDLNCKSGLTLGASISAQQGNTNISGRAVGVPGTLKVLDMVHQIYGKTAWSALWGDAIDLANNGFPMTQYMYSNLYNDGGGYDEDTGEPLAAGGVPAWVNAAGTSKGAARCSYKDIHNRYCDLTDSTQQKPLAVGTLIKNPDLANTMTLVRDGGAAAFYDPSGPIVAAILARFKADKVNVDGTNNCYSLYSSTKPVPARIPSLMSAADFSSYQAIERKPLVGTRFGQTIYTQPAPSFGGTVILYTLGLMERKNIQAQPFNSAGFVYLATEASRLANADRRNVLGDPAYSNVNTRVTALLSPSYLDARAALITDTAIGATVSAGQESDGIPAFAATDPTGYNALAAVQHASPMHMAALSSAAWKRRTASSVSPASHAVRLTSLASVGMPADHDEDFNTTSNVAIIDGYGSALSMTTTINTHFGAHIEAAGMLLNDALSNFSAGAVGSDVNGLAPYKRPRSSISPSIAFDSAGKLSLVWGSAGGGPIPDYIVKTFLGNKVYNMDLQAAIDADNWTGQDSSTSVAGLETGKPIASLLSGMSATYGYAAGTIETDGLTSGLSGIAVTYDPNGFPIYAGAADNRRNGSANGY